MYQKTGTSLTRFNRAPKISTDAARENKGQLFFRSSVTHFPSVGSHCRSLLSHFCLLSKTVGSFHLSKGHAPNNPISEHQIPSLLNCLPISCYHIPSFNPHDKPFLLMGSLFPLLSLPCHPPPTSSVTYLFCDRVLLLPLVVSSFLQSHHRIYN